MERPEVMQIMDEMLRDLHLDNHYDLFIREHNPLDGTHKESEAIEPSSFNFPWVDVRSYKSFQAALNTGKSVYVPEGVYNLKALTMNTESQCLAGAGWGTVLSFDDSHGIITQANNINIRNMKLILADQGKDFDAIRNTDGSTRFNYQNYKNIWFVGWQDAIYGLGATSSIFNKNKIQNCQRGIYLEGLAVNNLITANIIDADDHCLYFLVSTSVPEGMRISDNILYGATNGIYANRADFLLITNNIIDHVSNGINFVGSSDTGGHILRGNWIGLNAGTGYGIKFNISAPCTIPSIVALNEVKAYGAGAKTGISIGSNSPNTMVMGNSVINMNTYDMEVASDENVVAGNILVSPGAANNLSITGSNNSWFGNIAPKFGVAGSHKVQQLQNHITRGASAPVAGTWAVGDICWDTNPAAGATPGWVCTTAGTPGTWKAMANLAA